jgi:hypothetical protein
MNQGETSGCHVKMMQFALGCGIGIGLWCCTLMALLILN